MQMTVQIKKTFLLPAALATAFVGLAVAQTTQPVTPAPPPAVASGDLPIPPAPAPKVSKAWILMDYATGQVLAGENIDAPLEPASITKVMTSYVIASELAKGKLKAEDPVMMTENAWRSGGAGTDGSYSGFEVNKTAPLEQMEKGMVVQSGAPAEPAPLAERPALVGQIRREQVAGGRIDGEPAGVEPADQRVGMRRLGVDGGAQRLQRVAIVESHVRRV